MKILNNSFNLIDYFVEETTIFNPVDLTVYKTFITVNETKFFIKVLKAQGFIFTSLTAWLHAKDMETAILFGNTKLNKLYETN